MRSHQTTAPGSPKAVNPVCSPACQRPKAAPVGSAHIPIHPKGPTCMGSYTGVAPAPTARAAWAAMSSVAR